MKSKKTKLKELSIENAGVEVIDFAHPYSGKNGCMAFGVVCGYSKDNLIVKLKNCKGWDKEGIGKAQIEVFIEEKSLGHKNGYWFISKEELADLAISNFKS